MLRKETFINQRSILSSLRCIPVIPPIPLSDETQSVIELLRSYLKRAEAGKVHGMCLTAANEDQTYDIECAGSYQKFPTDAIGPLRVLELKLARKALDEH